MTAPELLPAAGLFVLLAAVSAVLTRAMIAVAILDVPNARSSHDRPTPKSGGVAVTLTLVAGLAGLHLTAGGLGLGAVAFWSLLALLLGLLALTYVDDRRDLPVAVKFAGQVAAALLFSLLVAVLPLPQPLGHLITVCWIVGFMNAFNFMDGINGIAGGTALLAGLFLAGLAGGGDGFVAGAGLCLAGALAGFLVFNFPAGRIFLGDTGSQVIAFLLAGLAVIGAAGEPPAVPFLAVPVLASAFLFDVALTLAVRARQRRNVLKAHRQHVYQLLVRAGWRHAAVTPLYLAAVVLSGLGVLAVRDAGPAAWLALVAALVVLYAAAAAAVYRHARRHGVDTGQPY